MSNYNDLNFIFNLDIEDFLDLVEEALKKEDLARKDKQEELLLHRWGYELMHHCFMEKPIQFEEYKDIIFGRKKTKTKKYSKEENEKLIEEMNKIKELDQRRSREGGE